MKVSEQGVLVTGAASGLGLAALDAFVDLGVDLRFVVQCAGVATPGRIVGRSGPHDLDKYRTVIEINLVGTFNVLRLAADRMARLDEVDGERGVIVLTHPVRRARPRRVPNPGLFHRTGHLRDPDAHRIDAGGPGIPCCRGSQSQPAGADRRVRIPSEPCPGEPDAQRGDDPDRRSAANGARGKQSAPNHARST
jgi:hypothetical protein